MQYLDKLISDLQLIRKKYEKYSVKLYMLLDESDTRVLNISTIDEGGNTKEIEIDKLVNIIYIVYNRDNNKIEGVDVNEINNELFYSKKYDISDLYK